VHTLTLHLNWTSQCRYNINRWWWWWYNLILWNMRFRLQTGRHSPLLFPSPLGERKFSEVRLESTHSNETFHEQWLRVHSKVAGVKRTVCVQSPCAPRTSSAPTSFPWIISYCGSLPPPRSVWPAHEPVLSGARSNHASSVARLASVGK